MKNFNNHTRNQRRMYRIHKLEEKTKSQELIIGSYKQKIDKVYIKVSCLLDCYNHYKVLPNSIIDELIEMQQELDLLMED